MKGAGCWKLFKKSARMKTPCAHAREALMRTAGKPKNSTSKGAGGYPKFFSHPNLILFVSINSVQNFNIVAQPLLEGKFVVGGGWVGGWVGGGGG